MLIDKNAIQGQLDQIDATYGEDLADAIDEAVDIINGEGDLAAFYLAVLFSMPLPHPGAADELISFFQGKEAAGTED